jgi:cobalamin biosynthesis protein CobT
MTMAAKKVRGSVFSSGHQALTRGLLKDTDVTVISRGSDFYNENDFPLLFWMVEFGEFYKRTCPVKVTKRDVDSVWSKAKGSLTKRNRIVIASTPEWVDKDYMNCLDGGILHEAFHSLYTLRGSELDTSRLARIMMEWYNPEIDYASKISTLKIFFNIFEDAYIERRGIEDFRGALSKIQTVHELVWKREAEARRHQPMGTPFTNAEGKMMRSMNVMGHLSCYLRDRVEHYLERAPLDEYDQDVRQVVDIAFAEVIKDSDASTSSYDTFELAMRTLAILHQLAESGSCEAGDPADDESPADQSGEESEDQSDQGSGSGKGSSERSRRRISESDPSKEDSEGEGKCRDAGEDSGSGENKDSGDQRTENQKDPNESKDSSDPAGDEDSGEQDEKDSRIPDHIRDALKDPSSQIEGLEDNNSSLKQEWEDHTNGHMPRTVFPFTREYDTVMHIQAKNDPSETETFSKICDDVKSDTLYIRPKMLSFFRGQTKTRMQHRQEKGRRLSSRSVSEVTYKEKPRPFMTKDVTRRKNSCVSLLLDESSSMSSYMKQARQILATLAMTIGDLRIPMEVIGFTSNEVDCLSAHLKESPLKDSQAFIMDAVNRFTRVDGVRYRIFRTFDEPFNINSYRKLVHTEAYGSTPLPDAVEFASNRIRPRSEDQKILFVVTDGYPCYSRVGWTEQDYLEIMKRQVEDLRREDIEVLFIGVGRHAKFVERFPNSVHISEMRTFSHTMATFIFEQMQRLLSLA